MTDILCNWLNSEVKLSSKLEPSNFAREFSSGFLLGELLHKFGLQNDFDQFSQNRTSEAKINNFTRIEPNLHLLDVSFDTNIARDVMTEKQEAATKLLYELFIALSKKQKNHLTGVAMETMRPAAPVKLEGITSTMYKERLKHLTPRQTDLNIDMLMTRFHEKQQEMEKTAFGERLAEEEKRQRQLQEQRLQVIQRLKENREQTSETMAKILAANVNIPKPPPNKTAKAIAKQKQQKKAIAIEHVMKDIAAFDKKIRQSLAATGLNEKEDDLEDTGENLNQRHSVWVDSETQDEDYMLKLKKNSAEMKAARLEREKRRRKVLFEQLKAHEAQEEKRRESVLVNQLLRQSIQERRIATQLLNARHEKQVICNNRLMREKQFEEYRRKEFQLALNKEADAVRLAKIEHEDQIRKKQKLHNRLLADRAREKYKKHYNFCAAIVSDLVDMVSKCAEYRELTNRLIPARLMRDWMDLFVKGEPQYITEDGGNAEHGADDELRDSKQKLDDLRHQILTESDFSEYRSMYGEWMPPESSQIGCPPKANRVLGHVVFRLFNQVYPEPPPFKAPQFPAFKVKACVLGKSLSGKTTCAKRLKESLGLEILSIDRLLHKAIEAFNDGEVMEEEYIVRHDVRQENSDVLDSSFRSLESGGALVPPLSPGVSARTVSPAASHSGRSVATTGVEHMDVNDKDKLNEEKKDQEKPYFEEIQIREVPTVRARLGQRALDCLNQGAAIDDEMLVYIIVDGIRNLPEGCGWLIDGFPVKHSQLMLLEHALTGYVAANADSHDALSQMRPKLVLNPHPAVSAPNPKSGLDVVIEMDLSDDTCLRRSSRKSFSNASENQSNSALDDGVPIIENYNYQLVLSSCTGGSDQEHIQYSLAAFSYEWPHLEEWFTNYGHLVKLDAELSVDDVTSAAVNVIDETLKRLEGGSDEAAFEASLMEEEKPPEVVPVEPAKPAEIVPEPPPPEPKPQSASSPKSSQKSQKASKTPKKGGKGKKELEPEPEQIVPTGPPPPQPGSDQWIFVMQPVGTDLAQSLVSFWKTSEESYITNCKDIFRLVRDEREQIIRYLYQIKLDFKAYLSRPDLKQEFVAQWQKNFNEIPDDLRDDGDMKADLHQRVDDLRERLWNIGDERKDQAEKERSRLMSNAWMDDHTGFLSNHYISLIQVELDRFQDSVHVLQDYYRGMEGKVPEETSSEFARIPLLEILPAECLPGTPSKNEVEDHSPSGFTSPLVAEVDAGKKSITPVGRKKKTDPQEPVEEKKIIPLVSRRPLSPENTSRSRADKTKGKSGKESDDLPHHPQDPDDKLIHDAVVSAISVIDKILSSEAAQREAEEEAERQKQAAKEAERKKLEAAEKRRASKAVKTVSDGKKSRTPSPKKGRGKEAEDALPAVNTVVEETEEEKQKKVDKEKGKQEYFTAITEEAVATKCRMNLIRSVSVVVLQELKTKVEATFNEMNDWIGDEFLHEMTSIDQLTEVLRNAIETSSKLYEELTLEQKGLIINKDVVCDLGEDAKLTKVQGHTSTVEIAEEPYPDMFTVNQIKKLYYQFSLVAPRGFLPIKSFQEMIQTLSALAQHSALLPETWLRLNQEKLEQVSLQLSTDNEYINWRSFLLLASQPWPLPTQTQLLESLRLFHEMDQRSRGVVTREQFNEVSLWLKDSSTDVALSEERRPQFDRMTSLTDAFFDIFADHSDDPSLLNYVEMLMYFSMALDPFEGFLRALSVVTGQHMPRLAKKKMLQMKVPTGDGIDDADKVTEDEAKVIWPDDIPQSAINAKITLDALLKVTLHGKYQHGESNRFILHSTSDSKELISKERLANIFMDLGANSVEQALPLTVLLEHPTIQDLVYGHSAFKFVDLKSLVASSAESFLDSTEYMA